MSDKRKILVAEDDSGIRLIIRTRLEAAGYQVETARNGLEAMNVAQAFRPDALVLDINMPELDGFGVLERLQKASETRIPTLVLTARHAADDVKRAVRLGAKDYLTKPFSETQLMARVARLLRPAPPRAATNALEL
jgi:two-component system OmpR family response regulator